MSEQNKASPAALTDEREAFEAHMHSTGMAWDNSREDDIDGDEQYADIETRVNWGVWQARALLAHQTGAPAALTDEHHDFYAGVCVSLACVLSQDNAVLWREIVRAVGEGDLLQYAAHVEPAEWELAGFARYAKSELGAGKPRFRRKLALLAAQPAAPVQPDECAQDVYQHGVSIGLFDIPKATANAICAGITAVTGARVDWHYIAGRVHMKALAEPAPADRQGVALSAEHSGKGISIWMEDLRRAHEYLDQGKPFFSGKDCAELADLLESLSRASSSRAAVETAPCKGMNCGCTDGWNHSAECQAEHAASIAGGRFVK